MPRNASGSYSLPAIYLATTGQDILAIQHNTPLTDIASDLNAARPITAGGTGATTASAARDKLGLTIGVDVQAFSTRLTVISGLAPTDGNLIVGNGTTWATVASSTFATAAQGTKADNALPLSGGTMTGNLTLKASPTTTFMAATKGYVDSSIAAIPVPPAPDYAAGNAALAYGTLGTYVLAQRMVTGSISPGAALGGGSLGAASAGQGRTSAAFSLSGTWRNMSGVANGAVSADPDYTGLFLRIA